MLWKPNDLGYLAGYAAVLVASGKINGTQGQTFTAGKLGSFTVGADVQEATAKALLIDGGALAAAQQAGDVLAASAVLMDAYDTDVRPLLAGLREEAGLDPDPVAAYRGSGYGEKIVAERVGGTPASWGS